MGFTVDSEDIGCQDEFIILKSTLKGGH